MRCNRYELPITTRFWPLSLSLLLLSCTGDLQWARSKANSSTPATTGAATTTVPDTVPFVALSASSYVSKIKGLLTGLAATADEVSQGQTDAGLDTLVQSWQQSPGYQDVLLNFFGTAFQQSAFQWPQIYSQAPAQNIFANEELQMLRESFPRTALYYVNSGLPFNQLMSTQKFMMTPRLLMFYAYIDGVDATDEGNFSDYMLASNPTMTITYDPRGGTNDPAQFANPSSPNYLRFYWPSIATPLTSNQCGCDPSICRLNGSALTIPPADFTYSRSAALWETLFGNNYIYFTHTVGNTYCVFPPSFSSSIIQPSDNNWRMVTLRQPAANEKSATVLDVVQFRQADNIAFRVPRIGFFTTPSFLGQWESNVNNQQRVLVNQALAVGVDKLFDGSDQTIPPDLSALPTEHAAPNTSCYGCHVTMDPMRQYLRQSLSVFGHPQTNPNLVALPGAWGQDGVASAGGNLLRFGKLLETSPSLALGWTAKVCTWLNSSPCEKTDPELARIADAFAASNFNFNTLVRLVATSPLTTYKVRTKTAADRGAVVSIARREQFCQMLSSRLGKTDFCGLAPMAKVSYTMTQAGQLLLAMPADGYSRNSLRPIQSTTPSVPVRLGMENVCSYVAQELVDNGANATFSSADPNASINRIMTDLFGLDPNSRTDVRQVLSDHYNDAVAASSPAQAMQSTVALACLSPFLTSVGL